MPMMKQPATAGQTTVAATHPLPKRARRRERHRAHEGAALYAKPLVAARCDGALLVSTIDLTDRDLSGREVETYITLTETEARAMRGRVTDAFGEAAAHLAAALPKRRKP